MQNNGIFVSELSTSRHSFTKYHFCRGNSNRRKSRLGIILKGSGAYIYLNKRLTVTEGAYSMHPELGYLYDLSVFLDVDPELQKNRILKRNSLYLANRFFTEWIPMEAKYFHTFGIKEKCNMVIEIK